MLYVSAENSLQLFIPRGFLHGFVGAFETAEFFLQCDNYYNKESESGVVYNDTAINIDWLLPQADLNLSVRMLFYLS